MNIPYLKSRDSRDVCIVMYHLLQVLGSEDAGMQVYRLVAMAAAGFDLVWSGLSGLSGLDQTWYRA